jgi:uncharacterized protein YqeY
MTSGVRDRLQAGLVDAMKKRDTAAVKAHRSALGAIGNAEAVADTVATSNAGPIAGSTRGLGAGDAPRRVLSEPEVRDIVHAEVEDRLRAAQEYEALSQSAAAAELRAEAGVLRSYLES